MLRNFIGVFVAALTLVGVHSVAVAGQGTADEAKAMVEKAAKLIESEGMDKAIATFNAPESGYKDRDLYIVVVDMKTGAALAHAANQALVGKAMLAAKDADGKLFVKESIDVAQASGSGWVDYKWVNPVTKKIEQKSMFVKKVGDLFVGCGIYKS